MKDLFSLYGCQSKSSKLLTVESADSGHKLSHAVPSPANISVCTKINPFAKFQATSQKKTFSNKTQISTESNGQIEIKSEELSPATDEKMVSTLQTSQAQPEVRDWDNTCVTQHMMDSDAETSETEVSNQGFETSSRISSTNPVCAVNISGTPSSRSNKSIAMAADKNNTLAADRGANVKRRIIVKSR